MTPAADRAFRDAIGSFRRMTRAEIRLAKPHRIKVVTVGPRDTIERLARRMAVSDRQVEHFRVLNGLGPNDKLRPGEPVKIVVE